MRGEPHQQHTLPSDAATRRLQVGLEAGIASFAEELDTDLRDVERAVASGREGLAVEVLEEHLARLEHFSEQLKLVVAGAAVEREAEHVVATAAEEIRAARPVPVRAGLTRGLLVAVCMALLAILAVGIRPPATDPLLAAATASEQALVAARAAAAGSVAGLNQLTARSAELRSAITELDAGLLADPDVRVRLQIMLADQQRALVPLSRQPAVAALLAELEELARSLDLRLPSVPPAGAVPDVTDGLPEVQDRPASATGPSVDAPWPTPFVTAPADGGPLELPGATSEPVTPSEGAPSDDPAPGPSEASEAPGPPAGPEDDPEDDPGLQGLLEQGEPDGPGRGEPHGPDLGLS